ncbi:heavy-metal-associated domain-containing protein [Candidatus Micrarchaeota archaeon]|nr:heavy-metal-associated domain-containing protein [Candidatus Micrarchaeota archaeon]
MEKTINVQGMHCKSCEMLLVDSISQISGVEKVSADSKTGKVVVQYKDESVLAQVKLAIQKENYKVIG